MSEKTSAEVRADAVPGVRCGKCLGRVDQGSIDMKRRLHERLHPGQPFEHPRLCSECWLGAIMNLCNEDDDVDLTPKRTSAPEGE